jgi:hypothetical protein
LSTLWEADLQAQNGHMGASERKEQRTWAWVVRRVPGGKG